MYGGQYGSGTVEDEKQLVKVVEGFKEETEDLRKHGMEKIEIERLPERVSNLKNLDQNS